MEVGKFTKQDAKDALRIAERAGVVGWDAADENGYEGIYLLYRLGWGSFGGEDSYFDGDTSLRDDLILALCMIAAIGANP